MSYEEILFGVLEVLDHAAACRDANERTRRLADGLTILSGTARLYSVRRVADQWQRACLSLGAVRSRLGGDRGLIEAGLFRFAWSIDFPLFEWNEDEQKWDPAHHMFTMPQEQYLETLESNPGPIKGDL